MCERIGAIPAPPPTNTISLSVGLIKNSPYGPDTITLSPGLREKMYDEQTPGFTGIKVPFDLSQGGVAIRMLSITMLPSAGWLAIE